MGFFSNQAVGVEITSGGVKAVLLNGRKGMPVLERYSSVTFPYGAVKCSMRELNILEAEAFVSVISESVNSLLPKKARLSVSLPDCSGRVLLLDLETPFKTKQDGIDLVRWKLKKSFPFPIQDAHLDYSIIEEKAAGGVSVLVSCISLSVLQQYEELFIQAGFQPHKIDFTSFNLFNLFSSRFAIGERKAFVSWFGGVLTLFVFHEGKMFFCRTKEIYGDRMDVNRIYREINSSLHVYREKNPGFALQDVYCFSTLEDGEAFSNVVEDATGLEPVQLDISKVLMFGASKPDRFTLVGLASAAGAAIRDL